MTSNVVLVTFSIVRPRISGFFPTKEQKEKREYSTNADESLRFTINRQFVTENITESNIIVYKRTNVCRTKCFFSQLHNTPETVCSWDENMMQAALDDN